MKLKYRLRLLVSLCPLLIPQLAFAHAILISSTPAANSLVRGPETAIVMEFNSRVDGVRSRITVVPEKGDSQTLQIQRQTLPNELSSHAQLKAGKYKLYWQALAVDGHLTRGVISFTVQ